jgi:hypothetical protein
VTEDTAAGAITRASLELHLRLMRAVPHEPTEGLVSVLLRVGLDPDRHPEFLEPRSWADVPALDRAIEAALSRHATE